MESAIRKFEKYLKRRYPHSSTRKHYISDLEIFHQFVGEKEPREVRVQTIDNFIEAQQAAGLQASTINRRLSSLVSFFDYLSLEAEADDWLNPVRWKQHRVQQGRHLPRDVTDQTAEALLVTIQEPRDRAIFSLMLRGGLRVGEVVALNWGDVEAPSEHNLGRLRLYGKGQKERIAWLTAESWLTLQNWLDVRPTTQEPALFLNQHGRRLSVAGVQYRLKQYTVTTGQPLSCHQLRHTYARRLAERDMPLDSLAKLLGHSSLQTTQLYIDGADPVVRRDFEQAMQQIADNMGPVPTLSGAKTVIVTSPKADERPEAQTILQELAYLRAELPAWLQPAIEAHMLRRMPRWATHHLRHHSYRQLNVLRRICGWLVQQRQWTDLATLQRLDLLAYVDHRLDNQVKASSINAELAVFHGFWRELIEREQVSNGAILLVKAPTEAKPLPRYLNPEQFQRLQDTLQVQTAKHSPADHFELAWFYLLAHAGLRVSEALNLRLADCDLRLGRLRINAGKGDRDRVVPMTQTLIAILQAYLLVRETAATDHVLIYRGARTQASLIAARLRHLGQRADVQPISPHRLRHTLATLLVNQGMPITSLQKFLGHQDINTTLIYARVFDQTVRDQFAAAMAQIEAIAVTDWPAPSFSISTNNICDSV